MQSELEKPLGKKNYNSLTTSEPHDHRGEPQVITTISRRPARLPATIRPPTHTRLDTGQIFKDKPMQEERFFQSMCAP
jgi:hypothetical protein